MKKKNRAAGYVSIAETSDTLIQLSADLLRQAAHGERRLVKAVIQVYYGDEEPLEGEAPRA